MPKCRYSDPLCPCQDGDVCHYEDWEDTKGWLYWECSICKRRHATKSAAWHCEQDHIDGKVSAPTEDGEAVRVPCPDCDGEGLGNCHTCGGTAFV